MLDPERRLHGYCPRGPLALPPGGAHWYVVPRVGYPDPATFARVVRGGRRRGSTRCRYERVVLGGFSQGAVMSLALGLGAGRPRPARDRAASRASSRSVDGWELDTSQPLPPVAIGHGTLRPGDPGRVRPTRARDRLGWRRGSRVLLYREYPLPHTRSTRRTFLLERARLARRDKRRLRRRAVCDEQLAHDERRPRLRRHALEAVALVERDVPGGLVAASDATSDTAA